MIKKYIFLLLSPFFLIHYPLKATIIETRYVEDALPFIDEETWFLVDLDNCLFEAVQSLGHANWFYDRLQNMIAEGVTREEAIALIYPDWIKTQNICEVKPLEESFPNALKSLGEKGVVIMGLTHRQPSVAEATFRQVRSLGLDFSKSAPSIQSPSMIPSKTPVLYSQGILFVGDYNKKIDIFESFLALNEKKPKKIVFIDDKLKNVAELEALTSLGIEYTGIYYTAIDHVEPIYVKEIAEFQYKLLNQILSNDSALQLMQNREFMSALRSLKPNIVDDYLNNFETLARLEKWDEIRSEGTRALEAAKGSGRVEEEAKICAQLTSTSFYQGDYIQALEYANRCHELSEKFENRALLLRALYLKSAIHRALAGKEKDETIQQMSYSQAVQIGEMAAQLYEEFKLDDSNLKGKIYFNWGAAHADNPKGDLNQALSCYLSALNCFKKVNATDDLLRIKIRLGKLYLLKNDYLATEEIIEEIRSQTPTERISMQIDYLEAQLKLSLGDYPGAVKVAKLGLERAKQLGAKEDQNRLLQLLQNPLLRIGDHP